MMARKPADTSTWEGRFGANLLRLMTRKHVTAQEMATALGVTDGAVYLWQSGKRLPTLATLPKIAEVLSLSSAKSLIPD